MANRSQPPEPGTPEYEWLYGKQRGAPDDATRMVRPDAGGRPADDATKVMPAQPAASRPATPTPAPHGGGGGTPPRRFGRRPRFGPFRALRWLLLLWLVFLIAVPFYAFSRVTTVNAEPAGERPEEQDGTTYLVVGSDSREDLTEEERRELGTGGASGRRTDTIMLLHVGSGPNLLLSLPRDSIVEIPDHGTTKINAAYAFGGPRLLVRTVEQNTGIRIDNFVEIGFGGFVDLVDAVGGIEICPENAMNDPQANLNIEAGCQEANGVTALGYARSRKTDPQLGDITRARHQREVVSAIGREATSPWTVVNPVRYWRVNMAGAETVRVSEGTGPIDLARFAWAMTRVDGENGLTCGVPIRDLAVNWDEERSRQMFNRIIEDDTAGIGDGLCTPSGLPRSVTG